MVPNYADLYEVDDPLNGRAMRSGPGNDPRYATRRFHEWAFRLFTGQERADPPLELMPEMGGKPTDIMWTTYIPVMAVSQTVVDLLSNEGLIGWSTYAVNVIDWQGQPLHGYKGLAVSGRAGAQDLRRGDLVDRPAPAPGGKPYQTLRGLYFQNDHWDGSDFSIVDATCIIVVTGRVVRAFRHAKIRNVRFVPLFESEIDIAILRQRGQWPP